MGGNKISASGVSRSGSKAIDVEEREKTKEEKKSVITMVSTCRLNQESISKEVNLRWHMPWSTIVLANQFQKRKF